MFNKLIEIIVKEIDLQNISDERKLILQPLIDFIQQKLEKEEDVNINFICTHNSRRSHLAQVWAQVASAYFKIPNTYCYSGGTEATAVFPKVAETLSDQGFKLCAISQSGNPVYAIKFSDNNMPIIAFSKTYDNPFNPISEFAAVMTCSQADEACPFIVGAEKRIPIRYEDPKVSDGTLEQSQLYKKRSLQIASEMFYVFSKIKR